MTQHPECGQSCTTPSSQVTVHPSRWFCRGAKLLVGVARHELSLPRPSAGPCKPLPLLHHSQIPRGWAPKSPLQSQWCEVRGGAPTECRTMLGRLVATVGSLFWLEEVVPLAVVGGGGVSPSSRLLLLLPHCYLSWSLWYKGCFLLTSASRFLSCVQVTCSHEREQSQEKPLSLS